MKKPCIICGREFRRLFAETKLEHAKRDCCSRQCNKKLLEQNPDAPPWLDKPAKMFFEPYNGDGIY